jgi:hypothetical protein
MKTIIETDRLLLREYVEADAEVFFQLNSDPAVLRFVPDKPLLSVEQGRQILVDHPIADYRKNGFGRGACILKSTGEQIGLAGLKYLDELGEVDVAYRLMPACWRRAWRRKLLWPRCGLGSPISAQADHRPGHAREHRLGPSAQKSGAALRRNGHFLGPPFFKIPGQ